VSPRKRDPEAVLIADGGVLVKHTHDLELATRLARTALTSEAAAEDEVHVPVGRAIWCRIMGCLPNSYGAWEGWAWHYDHAPGPARGVFPAVEFLP
jgi:hypothetical protein